MYDVPQTSAWPRVAARRRRGASLAAGIAAGVVLAVGALAGVGSASANPQLFVDADAGGDLVPATRLSLDDLPESTGSDGPGLEPPPPGRIAFPVDAADDCSASDNFGARRGSNRTHAGLDIVGSRGRAVYAVATGRLTQRYDDRGLTYGAGTGWKLYDDENDVVYKYFHLERHEPGLAVGDIVQFGDVIGYVGNTGTSGAHNDSNYHLHFEYRPGNVARDPRPLLVPHPNCPLD